MQPPAHAIGASSLERLSDEARAPRLLLEHVRGMVYRRAVDADCTLLYASEGCAQLTGFSAEELIQSRRVAFATLIHAEDRAHLDAVIRHSVATGVRYATEYRIVNAEGTLRWVAERGVAVRGADTPATEVEGFIEDITVRKRYEAALEAAEERYQGMFENAVLGMFRGTVPGPILMANAALARLYGYDSPRDLIEQIDDIARQLYIRAEDRAELLRRIESDGSVVGFETELRRRDGDIIWVSINAYATRDAQGRVLHFDGSVEDITERRRYQSRIEHQANYDALTGLANRLLLNERLDQAIEDAGEDGAPVAVAFVDLDQFKFINDSFGHALGDRLLQTMAERLRSCVTPTDTVARQGGDEFVLVLRSHTDIESITRLVQRIQAAIAKPWTVGRREFQINCSIGIALYPQDGRSANVLLRHADSAMYKAKESGRNNYQFFTAELNRAMVERLNIEHKLRGALERRQFLLHYQPRVNVRTGRVVGAEALLRWRSPKGELYRPDRFISVAEDTGLIVPIGKWVLRTACEQARSWQVQGLRPIVVSVNVSPRQFHEGDMVQTVAEALAYSGLPARYLQLELTETTVMHDAQKFVAMLDAIRRLGVQLAIDDFGTGYSSLSYLKRLPVDHLKIDRSFVKDLPADKDDAAIVQAIIALGHKLGLRVVAEGVETEEQREFLLRNRCDEMQGFYFCKPVPVGEFAAILMDSMAEPAHAG